MTDLPTYPITPDQPAEPRQPSLIDTRLLELLVCPLTKSTLSYDAARQELISRAARLAFPIIDGMPILVIAEARQLEDDDPALQRA